MELHNLKPAQGATKKSKRIGRGQGSGYGGTSTKGHKGAQSRSGYSKKIGHEGGQQPLQRRVPKFGFKNPFRVEYQAINLGKIEEVAKEKKIKAFDQKVFVELGLAHKNDNIKVLADGELTQKLDITAHKFSKKAVEMIEKAGGKATALNGASEEVVEEKKPAKKAAPKAKTEEVKETTPAEPAAADKESKAETKATEAKKEEPKAEAKKEESENKTEESDKKDGDTE